LVVEQILGQGGQFQWELVLGLMLGVQAWLLEQAWVVLCRLRLLAWWCS
jgi:hypothetical protein